MPTLDPADHGTGPPANTGDGIARGGRDARQSTASGARNPRETLLSLGCGLSRALLCLVRGGGNGLGRRRLRASLNRQSRLADGQPREECRRHGKGVLGEVKLSQWTAG